jgi:hypothetical protein
MLFHVTHVHTPESCPADDPERARDTIGKIIAGGDAPGIKLVGAWADAPGHTFFLVVETDSVDKLTDLFYPALTMAHAEITPVEDALALFKRRVTDS